MSNKLTFTYINHKGEVSKRTVTPTGPLFFGNTEWHPENQWFLPAFDEEKGGAYREFALKDCVFGDQNQFLIDALHWQEDELYLGPFKLGSACFHDCEWQAWLNQKELYIPKRTETQAREALYAAAVEMIQHWSKENG